MSQKYELTVKEMAKEAEEGTEANIKKERMTKRPRNAHPVAATP